MNRKNSYRWLILAVLSLAMLAVTLDATVLNLALPTLSTHFKASESELQWFVSSYTLALVAGMLPAGFLGDKYGRKALMLSSLIIFALGSLVCALAPNSGIFIAARVLLGFAGAALIVVALSMVTVLFSEEERPRAIGIWGAANFIGLPIGPILGGWILSNAWWGWIFLMNIPVSLLAFVAVLVLMPESRASNSPTIDFLGLVLSGGGLVGLMYGIIEAGRNGWGSKAALIPVVVGIIILFVFVLWEKRLAAKSQLQPLVDLALFKSRGFTWGVILTGLGAMGLYGAMFTLPQYFQAIKGLDPQGSGFRLLPLIAGLIVGAVPADRLASRIGKKITIAFGFAVVAVSFIFGSRMTIASNDWFVAAWTFGVGAGSGVAFSTAASAAVVDLSSERSGVGAALLQSIVKLGPAFGASILGSIVNSVYQNQVDISGLPSSMLEVVKSSAFGGVAIAQKLHHPQLLLSVKNAFINGMDHSLMATTLIAAGCVMMSLLFLPTWKKEK